MATVLVVEDSKNTRLLTAERLKTFYNIECACDGFEALDIIYRRHIDLIVADIMMPNMDGYELVKRLRSEHFDTPVMLLTAKQSFEDKKEGFISGIDDYMTKPVNYDELVLRINALLRRAKIASERKITAGELVVDASRGTVSYKGENIALTRKEFDLLFKFLSNPKIIFTKNQLLDDIWGLDSDCTEDTIKTHINRLRNKLSDCDEFEIVTIKGFGYKAELKKAIE